MRLRISLLRHPGAPGRGSIFRLLAGLHDRLPLGHTTRVRRHMPISLAIRAPLAGSNRSSTNESLRTSWFRRFQLAAKRTLIYISPSNERSFIASAHHWYYLQAISTGCESNHPAAQFRRIEAARTLHRQASTILGDAAVASPGAHPRKRLKTKPEHSGRARRESGWPRWGHLC